MIGNIKLDLKGFTNLFQKFSLNFYMYLKNHT